MTMRSFKAPVLGGLLFCSITVGSQAWTSGGGGAPAALQIVDNVEGSFVNLNLFPVRPIVAHPSGTGFFALNTHASTVERFDAAGNNPVEVWNTPWGPVALRLWTHPGTQQEQLLVSCRGSSVLARLDAQTGETLELVPLPSEPADLLVIGDDAFIACTALDTVVQLDLVTGARVDYTPSTHAGFNCKAPVFLAESNSGKVFVAPMHSGNNSTASRVFQRRAGVVLDLDDPNVAVQGLPDEDMFLINQNTQTVVAVGRGLGTTLFGFAINPVTTRTWILNTEANNKGPERQTEKGVRGDVVANRLSILRANIGNPPPLPDAIIDLDDVDPVLPGIQYVRTESVAQPFGLDFRSNGNGLIVSLGSDNVLEVDKDGLRIDEWDLPLGSIPRAVVINEAAGVFWVYCWGTNQVREYQTSDSSFVRACELSDDPTPANIAEGRRLFYSAKHSIENNQSCASCHVEGRTDFLAWNLEDAPRDSKGPLLTQSMSGIEKLAPFHWRGERSSLADFNSAFEGLLGGKRLTRAEFADFEAFVMSLTNPANPYLTRERELDDSKVPFTVGVGAQATTGQDVYFNVPISSGPFCNTCHTLPTGTNSDIFSGEPTEVIPRRVFNKVAPFNEIYRRLMATVPIETFVEPGNPGAGTIMDSRGYLGVAATHSGLIENFTTRIDDFFNGITVDHLTSFVMQVDQGVAPAIHQAFLLDAGTLATVQADLENYLLPAAMARQCDVVVVGRSEPGAVQARWAWDRASNTFLPDHATLTPRTLADFINGAGAESHVFYGMPVGMAARTVLDRDLDGIINALDPAPEDPDVDGGDSTAPVFLMAPTLQWKSSKVARLQFETDEPTVYRITYGEGVEADRCVPKSADCSAVSTEFGTSHSPLLGELMPSTDVTNGVYLPVTFSYAPTIEVFDRAGNSTSFTMPSFDSNPYGPGDEDEVIIGRLYWAQFDDVGPGPLRARANAHVVYKRGAPPLQAASNYLVVWRVLVNGEVNDTWIPGDAQSFRVDHVEQLGPTGSKPMQVSGPLLVGFELDAMGETHVSFEIPGLQVGQVVTLSVESVIQIKASQVATLHANLAAASACATSGAAGTVDCDGDGQPDCCLEVPVPFHIRAGTRWSMPDTNPARRALTEPFDPAQWTPIPLF